MQDEWVYISTTALSQSLGVPTQLIDEMIELGIVQGEQRSQRELVFTSIEIYRIRKVIRLNRDLGVNTAGAALILDLLDQIENLKRQLPK
ncbi:chaperone modulator CbpM [Legionella sp. W05-934-2]|jgi:chaperone modulatory protein CbpM|uniref:chaperone modulator CbpM n=1 Tax=Legionella sp. W05-934-2 TaxID=1198649 RepID=UPI00346201DD